MKRARTDSLTGGSGDVNPQYITGNIVATLSATTVQQAIQLPIFREATSGAKAWVVELLRMYVNLPDVIDVAVSTTQRFARFALVTAAQAAPSMVFLDSPQCLAFFKTEVLNLASALGTGAVGGTYGNNSVLTWDFTDGDGHGVLVATDSLFVVHDTTGMAVGRNCQYKILYRFKKVSLTEYIGIVQSQQSPVNAQP